MYINSISDNYVYTRAKLVCEEKVVLGWCNRARFIIAIFVSIYT